MKWRCVSDYFKYCEGEPDYGKKPVELGAGEYLAMGTCKLSPKTCGRCQTFTEQLKGMSFPTSAYKVVRGRLVRRKVDD